MARVNHPNFRELGWGDTLLYKLFGQKEWARKRIGGRWEKYARHAKEFARWYPVIPDAKPPRGHGRTLGVEVWKG